MTKKHPFAPPPAFFPAFTPISILTENLLDVKYLAEFLTITFQGLKSLCHCNTCYVLCKFTEAKNAGGKFSVIIMHPLEARRADALLIGNAGCISIFLQVLILNILLLLPLELLPSLVVSLLSLICINNCY